MVVKRFIGWIVVILMMAVARPMPAFAQTIGCPGCPDPNEEDRAGTARSAARWIDKQGACYLAWGEYNPQATLAYWARALKQKRPKDQYEPMHDGNDVVFKTMYCIADLETGSRSGLNRQSGCSIAGLDRLTGNYVQIIHMSDKKCSTGGMEDILNWGPTNNLLKLQGKKYPAMGYVLIYASKEEYRTKFAEISKLPAPDLLSTGQGLERSPAAWLKSKLGIGGK